MSEILRCHRCGTVISPDTPQRFCAGCLTHEGPADTGSLPLPAPVQTETITLPADALPATSSDETASATISVNVPGYEILAELGRGGMGVVYRARQTTLRRLVALKMILGSGHAGAADLARFRTEAEAIARLQHPNIVQVFEVGEHDGLPFFSLELCGGGSLAEKLDGTPLAPEEAARLVEVLARAVFAAHQKGIIHRDLKPANVLLLEDGTPKITDFGLAKKLDDVGQTQPGSIMGTPSYMAPEQAGGQKDVGTAADVYALGAILYELLTGRPPFRAATPLDTILQVIGDEPVPPRQLQPKTPRDLETICLKCLQKEPGKRYGDAWTLAEDLRRFQAGEPIVARPVGATERIIKWVKRRPLVAGLLAAVVLVTLVGVAGVAWAYGLALEERDFAQVQEKKAQEERNLADSQRQRAEKGEAAAREQRQKAENEKTAADQARKLAEAQKVRAEKELLRAEWLIYADKISLAQQAWENGNVGLALDLLDECRWDFRGWEHDYLYSLCHSNLWILHPGLFQCMAVSADGKRFVTGGWKHVTVWDVATGKETLALKGHFHNVVCLAFSPDGSRIASGAYDLTARIWDATSGKQLFSLPVSNIAGLAFSPDGKRLVTVGDGAVKVWDATTGKLLFPLKFVAKATSFPTAQCAACSADGKLIAAGSWGDVRLWDAASGQELRVLRGNADQLWRVVFSPDGKKLVCEGADGSAFVWDTATGEKVASFSGYRSSHIKAFAFSPDGKRVASAGADHVLRIWDSASGNELLRLQGHTGTVRSVAFTPDGDGLVSDSDDGTVRVWRIEAQGPRTFTEHASATTGVAFDPDGRRLIVASGQYDGKPGEIKTWDMATGRPLFAVKAHKTGPISVACSPDGKLLASGGQDKQVILWNAEGQEIAALPIEADLTSHVCFSPNGKILAAGMGSSGSQSVRLWDVASRREIPFPLGMKSSVGPLTFSADSTRLAAVFMGVVKVYEVPTGREVGSLHGADPHSMLLCLAFSPRGNRLAAGEIEGGLHVWDVETGNEVYTLAAHTKAVQSVSFSPDGRRIVSGSGQGNVELHQYEVKVWEAATGKEVHSLMGHTWTVTSAAFSPDNQWIVTSSDDTTIRVWNAQTGKEVRTYLDNGGRVATAFFSPDGHRIISAGAGLILRRFEP